MSSFSPLPIPFAFYFAFQKDGVDKKQRHAADYGAVGDVKDGKIDKAEIQKIYDIPQPESIKNAVSNRP